MSNDSLLTSVYKYHPRKDHTPEENFTTEAFAWLLRNDKQAEETFLSYLGQNCAIKWEWKTQFSLDNGKIPDLVALSEEATLIIEIKVDSALHQSQLDNYRAGAINLTNPKIILLTRHTSQQTQKADKYLTWENVYFELQKIESKTWKIEEFLSFINFLVKPVQNKEYLWFLLPYYPKFIEIMKKFPFIFANVVECIKKERLIDFANVEQDNRWGRKAITWTRKIEKWLPGITVGLMEDPKDHCFEWITNAYGTPFGLLIDIDHSTIGTPRLVETQIWTNFVDEVKNEFEDKGWNVYDAFHDGKKHGVENLNNWHPLYIWKPFYEIVSDASQATDAGDSFDDTLIRAVKDVSVAMYTKMINMPTFQALKATLETKMY